MAVKTAVFLRKRLKKMTSKAKSKSEIQKVLSGKAEQTVLSGNNMDEAHKGMHWYNNGVKSILAKTCPEGFVKGRLK